MAYLVSSQRKKQQVFLPGDDVYYVEFCEFNRPGRDDVGRDAKLGGSDFIDTMLRHGISDYLLPGEQGQLRYTGTDDDFTQVYNHLDEDFEDWLIMGVARINKLRRADGTLMAPEEEGLDLGNLPGSPAEPSAEPPAATPAPPTQEPPPS
jgi:hypothetical protein